jgi:hypothetical protein
MSTLLFCSILLRRSFFANVSCTVTVLEDKAMTWVYQNGHVYERPNGEKVATEQMAFQ